MGRRLAWLLAAVAVLAPAPADAARVEVRRTPDAFCKPSSFPCPLNNRQLVLFTARPGEANRLEVRAGSDGTATFRDLGAAVEAGRGCRSATANEAVCTFSTGEMTPLAAVRVGALMGDRDDTVVFDGPVSSLADGGPGSDEVLGGPSGDTFYGGTGEDRIRAGGGDDALLDGSVARFGETLRDTGRPVTAEADAFDGGPGTDSISYAGRPERLRVNLGSGAAGARAEGDRLAGVEGATGGRQSDRLVGDAAANRLRGEAGHDVLIGGAGEDDLDGGRGKNLLRGGADDDTLYAQSGTRLREAIACGGGSDTVEPQSVEGWALGFVHPDCERVGFRVVRQFPRGTGPSKPVARVKLICEGDRRGCRVRMTVRLARGSGGAPRGRLLGARSMRFRNLTYPNVELRLSPSGRRLLRRAGRLLARVSIRDADGKRQTYLTRLTGA